MEIEFENHEEMKQKLREEQKKSTYKLSGKNQYRKRESKREGGKLI